MAEAQVNKPTGVIKCDDLVCDQRILLGGSIVSKDPTKPIVISGNTSMTTLEVTGALSAGASTLSSLTVTGATQLNTLAASGASSLSSLGVSGASTLNTLGVSGASTLAAVSATSAVVSGTTTLASFPLYSNITFRQSAVVVADKLAGNQSLVVSDFPSNVASWTIARYEEYRKMLASYMSGKFGPVIGWKSALSTATVGTPALGYTEPGYGQILQTMNLVGDNKNVNFAEYALSPFYELEVVMRVGSGLINAALTKTDIVNSIDAVALGFEYPAVGSTAGISFVFGSGIGGNNLLRPLNALSRLYQTGSWIDVPGTRLVGDWETVLSAPTATSTAFKPAGNVVKNSVGDSLQWALDMVNWLRNNGYNLNVGDILFTGTLVGVNAIDGTETLITGTSPNLSPLGVTNISVTPSSAGQQMSLLL